MLLSLEIFRTVNNFHVSSIENDNENLPNIGAVKVNEKTTSTLKGFYYIRFLMEKTCSYFLL